MLPFRVDPSWYEHTWLTEHPPSRAALLWEATSAVARHLALAAGSLAALRSQQELTMAHR